jgi:hypothetical protein
MPPEQAADAHGVDVRADIYALGCTLYTLLVGHPPFAGKTAIEVITKHMREPVRPPDQEAAHVPAYLSRVVMRMMAKRPQDRYADMAEVIDALEEFLGEQTKGPFDPSEEQKSAIASCAMRFNASSAAKARKTVGLLFAPLSLLMLIAAFFLPVSLNLRYQTIAAVIGFAVMTPLAYLAIQGLKDKTYLFCRMREYILGGGIVMLFLVLGGLTLFAGLLVALDLHWAWLIAVVAAVLVGWIFHFLFDSAVAEQRIDSVAHAEAMLKKLRRSGVSEAAVQQFVCRNAGEHWEEFFEALFGYESKIRARTLWGRIEPLERRGRGDRGRPRPTHAAWRDTIVAWIDSRQSARREARDRKHIEQLERQSYLSKGFPDPAARKKAREIATTIVIKAAEIHESALEKYMVVTVPKPPDAAGDQAKPDEAKSAEEAAKKRKRPVMDDEGLEGYERLNYFQRRWGGWSGFFLGSMVRLALGALLLTACVLWAKQNNLLPTREAAGLVHGRMSSGIDELTASGAAKPGETTDVPKTDDPRQKQALRLSFAPKAITDWFNYWSVGIAGVVLIFSALFKAPKLGLFLIPAALMMVLGPTLMLGRVPHAELVSIGVGLFIAIVGFQWTRD